MTILLLKIRRRIMAKYIGLFLVAASGTLLAGGACPRGEQTEFSHLDPLLKAIATEPRQQVARIATSRALSPRTAVGGLEAYYEKFSRDLGTVLKTSEIPAFVSQAIAIGSMAKEALSQGNEILLGITGEAGIKDIQERVADLMRSLYEFPRNKAQKLKKYTVERAREEADVFLDMLKQQFDKFRDNVQEVLSMPDLFRNNQKRDAAIAVIALVTTILRTGDDVLKSFISPGKFIAGGLRAGKFEREKTPLAAGLTSEPGIGVE